MINRQDGKGIDCFPEAPSEWERLPLGRLATIDPSYEVERGKQYPFVEMASVKKNFEGIAKFEERIWDGSGLSRFQEGDLIIGKITPCAEHGKFAIVRNLPDSVGLGSTEFIVVSPNDRVISEYLFAAISASSFHSRLVSRMEGSTGRLRITRDTVRKWLLIPVPPIEEQRRIATVLKLADDAITKAKVELQATKTVRRSLHGSLLQGRFGKNLTFINTKAGTIPSHWQALRLKECATIGSGVTLNKDRAARDNACRYLTVAHVQRGSISHQDARYLELSERERETRLLSVDDILVVEGHASSQQIGRAAIVERLDEPTTFQNHLFRVRPSTDELLPGLLLHVLNSVRVQRHWNAVCNTSSGLNTINRRNLQNVWIPFPPLSEQRFIVESLAVCRDSIMATANKVRNLEATKKSLLQSLVTGKVRIPEGLLDE